MDETGVWQSDKGRRLMSISVTFNVPLNIAVQGGPATIPVVVGVSLGEPKIVTHCEPQFDPQIRNCAQCGRQYQETRAVWAQYPQCGDCSRRERDRERVEYLQRQAMIQRRRREAQEEDRVIVTAVQRPRPLGFNEINGTVNWKEEGF